MAATATFSWTPTSSSNWSSSGNWTETNGSAGFATAGNAASVLLFNLGAGSSGAYTVNIDLATIVAGAVSITSSNATVSVGSNKFISNAPAAQTGAGGTLNISAGEVTLGGGTLDFYQVNVGVGGAGSSGEIFGYGTITNLSPSASGVTYTNSIKTVTGSTGEIVADGGVLDLKGAGGALSTELNASGNFLIDTGATLKFDINTTIGAGTTVNFQNDAGTLYTTAVTGNGIGAQFSGSSTPFVFDPTLDNLAIGATKNSSTGASEITLGTLAIHSASLNTSSGVLTVTVGTGTTAYQFDTSETGGYTSSDKAFFSGSNVWLDVACFAAGTRILTARGEVAVNDLVEDEPIVLANGGQLAVKWIGHTRIDLARHPHPDKAAPVRIRRNAFGENLPHRDLVVSPDHCLFVDGKLIPAKLLINDMTIVQERDTPVVTYYHVELDRHAVLLAEGLPAESYLDTGNRAMFANAGLALVLHPEFALNAHLKCWQTDACAPLTVAPDAVEPVWHDLAARAESLGYQRPGHVTTDEPSLHLLADGKVVRPLSRDGNRYVFAVPAHVDALRLRSRATVPSHLVAYQDDWRALGVAVRRLVVRDNSGMIEMPPDHPNLGRGWYLVERDDATMWRWTNGDAFVALPEREGPALLEVHVGMTMTYIVTGEDAELPRRLAA